MHNRRAARHSLLVLLLIMLAASGCGNRVPRFGDSPPTSDSTAAATVPLSAFNETSVPEPTAALLPAATIIIDAKNPGVPVDARLRGTNVPAWLQSDSRRLFDDPTFLARTAASGASVLRLPGGSWSNYYDWLGCETDNAQQGSDDGCYWLWAARPTDFLNLLKATDRPAMWTVSMEGSAKSAAALVAFFNGNVNDTRAIGVDRNGRDWLTVGDWARLRSVHGNPEPRKILLWEVGNEIYGAKPSTGGPDCAEYGWEEVWTCDGDEYVRGDAEHDGFLTFRDEMRLVDPDILVGAVGVPKQSEWNSWGEKVITGAGQAMDFYAIHQYAYGNGASNYAEMLAQPQATWPAMMADVRATFERNAGGREVPVAVTEYNLFAFRELDTDQVMAKAINALYIADTMGQLGQAGFAMANQYNLSNGDDGDDSLDVYGMLRGSTLTRSPQYYVFPLWQRFGSQMLPVQSPFDAATTLSIYAGRADDGALTLMAINKTGTTIDATIALAGGPSMVMATVDVVQASSLDASSVTFNGVDSPADDLADAPAQTIENLATPLQHAFPPYSITLLRLQDAAKATTP